MKQESKEKQAAVLVGSSDWLAARGWKKFPVSDTGRHEENWAKKFATPTDCNLNGNGVQIILEIWGRHGPEMPRGCELSTRAELPCGDWVDFKVYGLREDELSGCIGAHCERLLRAWEAAANRCIPAPVSDSDSHATKTDSGGGR